MDNIDKQSYQLAKKMQNIPEYEPYPDFVQRTMQEIEQALIAQGFQPSEIHQVMQEVGLMDWQSASENTPHFQASPSPHQSSVINSTRTSLSSQKTANKKTNSTHKDNPLFLEKMVNILRSMNTIHYGFIFFCICGVLWMFAAYYSWLSPFYLFFSGFVLGMCFFIFLAIFSGERMVARFALLVLACFPMLFVVICIQDIIDGEQHQKITDFRIDECHLEFRKENQKYLCLYVNDKETDKMIFNELGKIKVLREDVDKVDYIDLYYYKNIKIINELKVINRK